MGPVMNFKLKEFFLQTFLIVRICFPDRKEMSLSLTVWRPTNCNTLAHEWEGWECTWNLINYFFQKEKSCDHFFGTRAFVKLYFRKREIVKKSIFLKVTLRKTAFSETPPCFCNFGVDILSLCLFKLRFKIALPLESFVANRSKKLKIRYEPHEKVLTSFEMAWKAN